MQWAKGWVVLEDHIVVQAEIAAKQEKQEAVADVSKHDTKEEGESDHVEGCGVHFFVGRRAVGDDDLVERVNELVNFEVSGRCQVMLFHSEYLSDLCAPVVEDLILDKTGELSWNPKKPYQ